MEIRRFSAQTAVSKAFDRKRTPKASAKPRTKSSSPSLSLPLKRKLQWANTKSNPPALAKWARTVLSNPPLQAKSRGFPFRKGNSLSICAVNLANMPQKYELRTALFQNRPHGLGLEQAFLIFLFGIRLGRDGTAHRKGYIISIGPVQDAADDHIEIKIPLRIEIPYRTAVQPSFTLFQLFDDLHGRNLWGPGHTAHGKAFLYELHGVLVLGHRGSDGRDHLVYLFERIHFT